MIKRVVVAGCRDYNNYEQAREFIELCINKIKKENEIVFLSGDCRGADALGIRFAKEGGFRIEHYPAQWQKYGKSAGPKRNEIMAQRCDFVICFWDGKSRGTRSMIDLAQKYKREIRIKMIKCE